MVRSVIEYSSVTYGPLLTQYQDHELENIQKRCLRCMYGYNKSYAQLLEESGLQTLKARRENALVKFATNCTTNPIYQHWFRENQNPRSSQRNPTKYEENWLEQAGYTIVHCILQEELSTRRQLTPPKIISPLTTISMTHSLSSPRTVIGEEGIRMKMKKQPIWMTDLTVLN